MADRAREARPRRRRWWRALVGGALVYALAGVWLAWPFAWPFDALVNLGAGPDCPALRVGADGRVRVAVLQHGLWRTSASLGRLERTLVAHGYEVLNVGYPSTRARIEVHAEALAAAVAARGSAGRVDEWSFVGHSMGGLVIQQYLRRSDAVAPQACVYLATPHRGAVLADLRKRWLPFRLLMGTSAAMQLSPGDPLHGLPIPCGGCSGTIVGDLGEGNPSIPGRDDGTVAVVEATFAEAQASITLPFGHTAIAAAAPALTAVLHFLRHRAFSPADDSR